MPPRICASLLSSHWFRFRHCQASSAILTDKGVAPIIRGFSRLLEAQIRRNKHGQLVAAVDSSHRWNRIVREEICRDHAARLSAAPAGNFQPRRIEGGD